MSWTAYESGWLLAGEGCSIWADSLGLISMRKQISAEARMVGKWNIGRNTTKCGWFCPQTGINIKSREKRYLMKMSNLISNHWNYCKWSLIHISMVYVVCCMPYIHPAINYGARQPKTNNSKNRRKNRN